MKARLPDGRPWWFCPSCGLAAPTHGAYCREDPNRVSCAEVPGCVARAGHGGGHLIVGSIRKPIAS